LPEFIATAAELLVDSDYGHRVSPQAIRFY
jgi:hypothetical protein